MNKEDCEYLKRWREEYGLKTVIDYLKPLPSDHKWIDILGENGLNNRILKKCTNCGQVVSLLQTYNYLSWVTFQNVLFDNDAIDCKKYIMKCALE